MMTNQKRCARCISDTSIPDIRFDEHGVCNYCNIHDKMAEQFPLTDLGQQKFKLLIDNIKRKGKAKRCPKTKEPLMGSKGFLKTRGKENV